MSYANGTPFVNLPQTVGTDKRDWFDTNEAFLDLDAKVKAAYEGAIDTASALAALTEVVSGISSDVSDLQTTVGNHTTSIGTINEALTLINSALTSLNTTVTGKFDSAGVADPYDAEHGIYAVDDVVTYNGQRYVCHTAVTAAEPFDADKWTAVDIQAELDQIYSDLSNKADKTDLPWVFKANMVVNDTLDVSGLDELLFVLQDSSLHVSRGCQVIPVNWFQGGNSIEINTYVDQRRYCNITYNNGVITLYSADFGTYVDIVTVYGR